ncbi:serine/arginine-rich splicing factor SC35 isoform X4 [Coffea eugenioides]|uniref:serine/arginine-rich splicing factor SC35 isoform X4 n=1 Tax=Coffea eugenioides TaxID=49369 RepID=UPI000F60EAC5|nr:serine/arginine-rich splicing factor SC35 isoform X4 [Coffea eugenioides]
MSHFGRSGPPDIADTYSLLALNITFRTNADDLFPLFDRYGKVVDIFIPRDRRTGESRGFAFVRYKYADEAQKAVDRLDGKLVDGREIAVQFAKYGPNAERIHKGRIVEKLPRSRFRSRSRSPRRRNRDDYHRGRDYRRRSRSRSWDSYESDKYRGRGRDYNYRSRGRDYHYRSRSRSASPYDRSHRRGHYDDESPEYDRIRGRGRHDKRRMSSSISSESASLRRRSPSSQSDISPRSASSPRNGTGALTHNDLYSTAQSLSPQGRAADSQSLSPLNLEKVVS